MFPWLVLLLTLAENDPIKLAESHYEAGRSAYERGAWDVALIEFEAAFQLSREPDLLYNLSKTAEAAGALSESLRYARQYQAAKGTSISAKDADEVRGRIARLEALITSARSDSTSVQQSPPVTAALEAPISKERTDKARISPGSVALIVGGSALAVGGVGCLGAAWKTSQEVQAQDLTYQLGAELSARGRTLNAAGLALTISGSAVALAGTVWAVKHSSRR